MTPPPYPQKAVGYTGIIIAVVAGLCLTPVLLLCVLLAVMGVFERGGL